MAIGSVKKATRDSFGEALVEVGRKNENVVVVDADLAFATKTVLFKNAFPERFFDCGISESNLICVGAGLSLTGKIPFVASFAMFSAGRGFEQIRNSVAYPNLNVKIVGSHGGLCAGPDGATHQCLEDLALMRVVPGMIVLDPCDDNETKALVEQMVEINNPVYLRLSKHSVPNLSLGYDVKIGKGITLKDGSDVAIVAAGPVLVEALKAAQRLEQEGIRTRVINIHTIKPLDEEIILKAASETRLIFTVEEHSIFGGLGEAVCSLVCEKCPVRVERIGVEDRFGQSGSALELLDWSGLSERKIFETVKLAVENFFELKVGRI